MSELMRRRRNETLKQYKAQKKTVEFYSNTSAIRLDVPNDSAIVFSELGYRTVPSRKTPFRLAVEEEPTTKSKTVERGVSERKERRNVLLSPFR
jgi:hypothetical protein